VDIFKHTAKKKKINRADQFLPEVYGNTLTPLSIGVKVARNEDE
jgi:hypothetical protein